MASAERVTAKGRWKRRLAVLLALLGLFLLVDMWRSGPLWRGAYPFLPRQVQGVPYRLRARWAGPAATPVPLPTSSLAEGAGTGLDALDLGSLDAPVPHAGGGEGAGKGAGAEPATEASPARSSAPASGTSEAESGEAAPLASGDAAAANAASPPPGSIPPLPALPSSAGLTGLRHEYQTWNNCGPATISMALNLVGDEVDQARAARSLKPDPDDKNVSPEELARFAAERGYGAVTRPGGDPELLRRLLALGLPIVIETWFVPEPGDEMGHYRVVTGYREVVDANGPAYVFTAADSYLGPEIEIPEEVLDEDWRAFNRTFVVAYPPDREPEVAAALGRRWAASDVFDWTAEVAMGELAEEEDVWAWYNLGASLLGLGDPTAAVRAFDRARALGLPWRLLWYRFEAFEAYAAIGRWDDVLALAEANLRNAANLEESHYWRGRALEARGDRAGAVAAYREAQRLNPGFEPAIRALEGAP